MIPDDADIARMQKQGIKVLTHDGKPWSRKPQGKSEVEYLRDIAHGIDALVKKPDPEKSEAPKVTVNTPDVKVELPKPIKKWRFSISRDGDGRMKEIIATAIT